MPDHGFSALRRNLYERGIATSYAERLVTELREHQADLEAERRAAGDSRTAAAARAGRRLGSDAAIIEQVFARPELRGRWSGVRAVWRQLPPLGVVSAQSTGGAVAAPCIARWTASVSLGSLLTVAMLFVLAQAIALGV